jgi:methyltransferase-like protein
MINKNQKNSKKELSASAIYGCLKHVFWDCCNNKNKNIVKKTPETISPIAPIGFFDRISENVGRTLEMSGMSQEDKDKNKNKDQDFVVISIDGNSPVAHL